MLGHLAVVEEPRLMRLRSAWKESGRKSSDAGRSPSPSLSLVGKGQALLSAKSGKHLAVGTALSGAPSVFFHAVAIFASPEPAPANTSRQLSQQRVWTCDASQRATHDRG